MTRLLFSTLLLFSFLTTATAEDNNFAAKDALMAKSIKLLDEVLTAFESAKDEASSKEAIKKIQALMPKAQALKAEGVKLGMDNLSEKEQKALEAKYKDEQMKIQKRLFGVLAILQKNPALMGEFQKISKSLQ